ncbi:hypothetical protein CONPUDRAFT_161311 [Coniophora puteana RWD-64-598 SS2]|uniref:Uncharacterized protein n=1 Tax=Coniophora puteana (strain RWD-64-598) TaxID=741705 RepID=A0A5M3N5A0_CONPW|nr:uncharacterized protein CONPUDRAFT_161311 [Coniophora puteana RWD-64-598 SS2]EIW86590.1 hypothetical protein CONPUDRAFT_161311 [Coniophora puteana RWD-64-598 SS2]
MVHVPSRKQLEVMKRVDIQRLCKDFGVKANLKTEALIDLLVDASSPLPPRPTTIHPHRPSRIPSRTSARQRNRSNGSMVVHGSDEERTVPPKPSTIETHQSSLPPTDIHSRKAKVTQYRLGVGRPTAAGGSGARIVTRSSNSSKGSKPGPSARPAQVTGAPIVEEEDVRSLASKVNDLARDNSVGASVPTPRSTNERRPALPVASLESMHQVVAEAMKPLKKENESQKQELKNLQQKVESLVEDFETKIRVLSSEIDKLRERVPRASIHETHRAPMPPPTPKRVRTPPQPSALGGPFIERPSVHDASTSYWPPASTSKSPERPPAFVPSLLGKRPRDSITSDATGLFEQGDEYELTDEQLAKLVPRPPPKRAKIQGDSDVAGGSSGAHMDIDGGGQDPSISGDIERINDDTRTMGSPPPAERLPDFFATSPTPTGDGAGPSMMDVHSYNFNFLPTATPAPNSLPLAMGTFPYPEPPTSPSPADRPNSRTSQRFTFGIGRGSTGRTQPPTSAPSEVAGAGSGTVDPASLRSIRRQPSSSEIGAGFGLTNLATGDADMDDMPAVNRTMFGTELEGDTRFGDFGVDGVASGFWTGGRI